MKSTFIKISLGLFFINLVGVLAAGSVHAETSRLAATVTSSQPLSSKLTLKNTSGAACQVAATATGTVAITNMVQDGKAITPTPIDISLGDGLDQTLESTLKTLQPGQSVEIPLRASKSGNQAGITSVVGSPDGNTIGLLYLVSSNRPLEIELNYSVPIDSPKGAPLCGDAQASTISNDGWMRVALLRAVIAVLSVLLLVALWWLLKRRKKKPVTVVAALVTSVIMLSMFGRTAHAQVVVPDEARSTWDSCMATLEANRDITGPVLDVINSDSVHIVVELGGGGTEVSSRWPDGTYHLNLDLHDGHEFFGTGGFEDPCTSIYHEFYHVFDMESGTFSRDDCAGSGIETKEVMATRAQNVLRARLGMPQRSHYGRRALPAGDCRQAPAPPPCRTGNCGRTIGEPHLRTLDGLSYDFQGAGEFVLARSKENNFEVQVRQQQWQQWRTVAINVAAAVKSGGHTLQISPNGYKLTLLVDGKAAEAKTQELSGGVTITLVEPTRLDVTSSDGSVVSVSNLGMFGINVSVDPSEKLKNKVEGLLGNFNGQSTDDIQLQQSHKVIKNEFEQLYPQYADSWRITDQSSLFTYEPGKNTESYTNRAFPYEKPNVKALAGYGAAEKLCKQLGITDKASLEICAMDVAITGRPEFARSVLNYQGTFGGLSTAAATYILKADAPNKIAKATFTAKKGDKVFFDVFSATYPLNCGAISLRDANDTVLNSGCIINNSGYIETTTLPEDGEYSLQLRANEKDMGDAKVRFYRINDQTGTIAVDGPWVTATMTSPGMMALFTFQGVMGQRLFVSTSNVTLPSQCSPVSVEAGDGATIGSTCLINGKGVIDTMVLPENGTYILKVNPADVTTGKITLRLTSARLIQKTITTGDTVRLSFDKPGDEAEVRFMVNTGQMFYVDVSDSTIGSQCGGFSLDMPNGDKVDNCIIGKTATLRSAGVVAPASGVYVLHLNPVEANTGAVNVRVHL